MTDNEEVTEKEIGEHDRQADVCNLKCLCE